MPNYRPTVNGSGILAYVDSFAGLIPCTVLDVERTTVGTVAQTSITVRINARRGDYRRGETLTVPQHRVVPRDKVRTRNGRYVVLTSYAWSPGMTGSHNMHDGPSLQGIGSGDAMFVGGRYGIVKGVTIHPRGHDFPTVKPDYLAIEVRTDIGSRVLGATEASIGPDLRVHYKIDGFACLDGQSRD